MRLTIWVPLLFLLLSAAPVRAAEVSGSVFDSENNQPLGFVTVLVVGTSTVGQDLQRGVLCDARGEFLIQDIPLGRYVLKFSRVGYETAEDSLIVRTHRTYNVTRALVISPVVVPKIVVEDERGNINTQDVTSLIAMDAEVLAAVPAAVEADPIRSLQLLPGVQAASDYSSGLYIRGGGPDQTLVMLDDVPIYNATHAFGFFSVFNSDALASVDLYKGAYPAEQGGRLVGLVKVTSRDGGRSEVKGIAGASTIASRISLDGPVGSGTWMLSARRTHLDPLLSAIRKSSGENVPDYYFYDLNGKVTQRVAGGQLEAFAYRGRDDLYLEINASTNAGLEWGNSLGGVAFKKLVRENLLSTTRISASRYTGETSILALSTPASFRNRLLDITASNSLRMDTGFGHEISGGVQASRYDVWLVSEFNGDRQLDFRRKQTELSFYAEDRFEPITLTTLRAGLRVRYIDDGRRWFVEPRLTARRALTDRLSATLGAGIYNQQLQLVSTEGFSAADFYVPIDESAEPGQSRQVVGGLEWRPESGYAITVEGYYTSLRNLVELDNQTASDIEPETADDFFVTRGWGYASGAEVFIRRDRGNVTGWLGYTLGWTRRTFSELNGGRAYPPKYDRRHDINLALQYHRGSWTYGGTFVFGTGQAFTPASARYSIRDHAADTEPFDGPSVLAGDRNSARLLPYHRADLSIKQDFSMFGLDADWSLQIFNLYNRRNEWFVQYNTEDPVVEPTVVKMLPTIPSLGLTVKF